MWPTCPYVPSVSCGRGSRSRHRSCSRPRPAAGGRECGGEGAQTQVCFLGRCREGGGEKDLLLDLLLLHEGEGKEEEGEFFKEEVEVKDVVEEDEGDEEEDRARVGEGVYRNPLPDCSSPPHIRGFLDPQVSSGHLR